MKSWCDLAFSVALDRIFIPTSPWSLKFALAEVMLSVYKHPKWGNCLYLLPLSFILMLHTRMPLIWCCHEVITLGISYALADPAMLWSSQKGQFFLNGEWLPLPKTHTCQGELKGCPSSGHAHLHFALEREKQVMQLEKNKTVRAWMKQVRFFSLCAVCL